MVCMIYEMHAAMADGHLCSAHIVPCQIALNAERSQSRDKDRKPVALLYQNPSPGKLSL